MKQKRLSMANQLWTSRFGIAVILFGLVCVVLPNSNCLRDLQNTAQLRLSKATRMENVFLPRT